MPGRTTDIGKHAQPARAVAEYELGRFARIVRHRKRLHLQVVDRESFVIANHPDVGNIGEQRLEPGQRPGRKPDRNVGAARETDHAANGIVVLMRDDDGRDVFGNEPETGKPGHGSGKSKTAVEQQPRASRLDDQRIALTAAAQRSEPHSGSRHRGHRNDRYFNSCCSSARMRPAVGEVDFAPWASSTLTSLPCLAPATLMRYCPSFFDPLSPLQNASFDQKPFSALSDASAST